MTAAHPATGEAALPAEVGEFAALETALAEYRQAVLEHERAKGGVCVVELARARCLESEAHLRLSQVGIGLRLKTP